MSEEAKEKPQEEVQTEPNPTPSSHLPNGSSLVKSGKKERKHAFGQRRLRARGGAQSGGTVGDRTLGAASIVLLTCRCSSHRSCWMRAPRKWLEKGSPRHQAHRQGPQGWRQGLSARQGWWKRRGLSARRSLWGCRLGLSADWVRAGGLTPPQLPRHIITQVPGRAQDSLPLPEIGGSSCPPLKRAFVVPADHLQRQRLLLPPSLHLPIVGRSSRGRPGREPVVEAL